MTLSNPSVHFTAFAPARQPTAPAPTQCNGAKGMSAPSLGRNRPFFTPEINMDGLATFLRRQRPVDTRHMVAADTGLPEDTVRNWLERRNGITGMHLMVLYAVYGAHVLAAAWPDTWGDKPVSLSVAMAAQELSKLEAERARNETRRLELQAQLTSMGGAV